jgi:disulfide bond formation protein DsbB
MNRQHSLFLISALSLAVLLGAYAFQLAGYLPCHLCYIGRWAHYAVVPLGVVFALVPSLRRAGLFLLAALFLGNMVFSIWHSGIEWQWWAGPSSCAGGGGLSGSVPDFGNLNVVQCDEPAIRILWLSLAGWNAVISAGLAAFAIRQGSSSVSQ